MIKKQNKPKAHGGLGDDPYFVDVTLRQHPEQLELTQTLPAKAAVRLAALMRRAPPPVELPPIQLKPRLQPKLQRRSNFAYGAQHTAIVPPDDKDVAGLSYDMKMWDDIEKPVGRSKVLEELRQIARHHPSTSYEADRYLAMPAAADLLTPDRKQSILESAGVYHVAQGSRAVLIGMDMAQEAHRTGIAVMKDGKLIDFTEIYIDTRRCLCCGAPANEVQHD